MNNLSVPTQVSKKQEAHAIPLPNSQRFVLRSSAHRQVLLASGCGKRERPANKLASHVFLNGWGGSCGYKPLFYQIITSDFCRKFGNFNGTFGNWRGIVRETSMQATLCILFVKNIFRKCDDAAFFIFARIADFERNGHFNSPTPDSPRRGHNCMLIRMLYHPMSDKSTAKCIYFKNKAEIMKQAA